jgi:hypothetical protein
LGGGRRPKSVGRVHVEEVSAESGVAALDQYGGGEKDPVTGLYEWYEVPDGVTKAQHTLSWDAVFDDDCWPLLVADFQSEYHINLRAVFRTQSWDWFTDCVAGLMSCDSRLFRHFYHPEEVDDERRTDDGGVDNWSAEA